MNKSGKEKEKRESRRGRVFTVGLIEKIRAQYGLFCLAIP
jgi:hypothetical protein